MFHLTNTILLQATKKYTHQIKIKKGGTTKEGIIPSISGDEDIDNLTILVEKRVQVISSGA